MRGIFLFLLAAGICLPVTARQAENDGMNGNYPNNRYPSKPYIELSIGTVKPKGWMEEQMRRCSDLTSYIHIKISDLYFTKNLYCSKNAPLKVASDFWGSISGRKPFLFSECCV